MAFLTKSPNICLKNSERLTSNINKAKTQDSPHYDNSPKNMKG